MSNSELIAGIDLGTTNSSIAVLDNGVPKLIEIDGRPTIPSCVSLGEGGEILVGQPALNQLLAKPEDTILSIKRDMGSDREFVLGEHTYRAEEISAFILRKLRDEAETHLGQPIQKAVITVPAYFNEEQRLATKNAAELAGIECVRLLNEPTAAALAYDPKIKEVQNILVYDLGGGTFDVSLVKSSEGLVEVKASHGDTALGGDDVDELLIDYVISESEILTDRESLSYTQLQRLRQACEVAKCSLSDKPSAVLSEEYFLEDKHLDFEIEREEFNKRVTPLLEKTWTSVHACLHDGGIVPSDIDNILLVGGSTRMPVVSDLMEARIGISPKFEVNPDLIVTMGAALQAGIIAGEKVDSILVDISAHTYSTGVLGEYGGIQCVPIIKRGTPLPSVKSEVFYTCYPDQEVVKADVYQGESSHPDENLMLGEFVIEGLSKSDSDHPILCEFALDLSGILTVTATEKKTGLAKVVTIDTSETNQSLDLAATKEKLAGILQDDIDESALPEKKSASNEAAIKAVAKADKLLKDNSLGDDDRKDIVALLDKMKIAGEQGDDDLVSSLVDQLSDIFFYLE